MCNAALSRVRRPGWTGLLRAPPQDDHGAELRHDVAGTEPGTAGSRAVLRTVWDDTRSRRRSYRQRRPIQAPDAMQGAQHGEAQPGAGGMSGGHVKHERTCLVCGRTFESVVGRYCSLACRPWNPRGQEPWHAKPRTCPSCQQPAVFGAQAKECRDCRDAALVIARMRPCLTCGVAFTRPGSKRYCSGACMSEMDRRKAKASYVQTPERAYVCVVCGQEFTRSGRHGKPQSCSRRCGNRLPANIEAHRNASARRRAWKRGAGIGDPVRRGDIFERDGWRCQLCGKRLARDERSPHPLSPTIDHIVPLAAGGRHEPANVQAAHFLCNSRKGAKGSGQLRWSA